MRKANVKNSVYMSVDNQALEKGSMKGLADSYFFDDGMDSGHDCVSDSTLDY